MLTEYPEVQPCCQKCGGETEEVLCRSCEADMLDGIANARFWRRWRSADGRAAKRAKAAEKLAAWHVMQAAVNYMQTEGVRVMFKELTCWIIEEQL